MYTDYMDELSEKEKLEMQINGSIAQDKRINDLVEKIKSNTLIIDDLKDIFTRWSNVAQLNPQWTWPKDKPMWIVKCCEELAFCVGEEYFQKIYDWFMDDKVGESEFFEKVYELKTT